MDAHGHGTHVAGVIGAVGNNGIGVTGVNQVPPWLILSVMNALALLSSLGGGDMASDACCYCVLCGLKALSRASWEAEMRPLRLQLIPVGQSEQSVGLHVHAACHACVLCAPEGAS